MTSGYRALVLAGLVLLAGCAGGIGGTESPTPTTDVGTSTPPGSTPGTDGSTSATGGTLNFYVSDEKNAIGDFRHLNVTIDRVLLIRADEAANDDEGAPSPAETATPADPTATVTSTENGTTTTSSVANETADTATVTPTASSTPTETMDATEEADDSETDEAAGESRVALDVEGRTVDLTRLLGANATLIEQFDVPAGTYTKVFVHVSDVDATLDTGESVDVKLPSEKLHVNKPFEVEANESVNFVFDIAVHEAGKSGKYILRPVIGESGTDVPIDPLDDRRGADELPGEANEKARGGERSSDETEGRREDGNRGDAPERALNATFVGNVTAGGNATIEVTRNGSAVANATVVVNDEVVGRTDAAGRLTFAVPADVDELSVEIALGEAEAELEVEFETGSDAESDRGKAGGSSDRGKAG